MPHVPWDAEIPPRPGRRFLERDRIYWFGNGGDPEILVGSADWRRRNPEDRVEALVPCASHEQRLRRLLEAALADNRRAWDLAADAQYTLRRPSRDGPVRDFYPTMMEHALERREDGR